MHQEFSYWFTHKELYSVNQSNLSLAFHYHNKFKILTNNLFNKNTTKYNLLDSHKKKLTTQQEHLLTDLESIHEH